ELLRVVRYQPDQPRIQRPERPVHRYRADVSEFALTRYESVPASGPGSIDTGDACTPVGPEIVLVTSGRAEVAAGGRTLELLPGEAAFMPFSVGSYRLRCREPDSVIWRAAVGLD
ncbi:MAG: hypothetical protein OER95_02865, partial [Acidimicrobiia bacterium]|nr:hypothetical protein [Acidimicrobiia bacterium]